MRGWAAVGLCGLVGLAGCAGSALSPEGGTAASKQAGVALSGKVRGGQQPIAGAHVYLLAANTTGYGGNGIAAAASNASVSLLTSGTMDTGGGATNGDYYVTTDASGNWTISGDYTCTAGQQVYLYSLGGNSGSGTSNAAAGLMAALGVCPQAGNFATATPYIVINEVSTVAAAYAFAGFATDATHVSSSGTALAQTGIANAFANAANLETLNTGLALATTPAGNGVVPQAEINTLANVLASCVNTNGTVSGPTNATACYTLFANALASGLTGAQPTDTATAVINIAHNPGIYVDALYGLAAGAPPFSPGLSSSPNDWTVGIVISGGGLSGLHWIAIDGSGNAWVPNHSSTGGITEIASSGAFLSGPSGYTGGGMQYSLGIVIDTVGNAWTSILLPITGNHTTGNVIEVSSTGAILSGSNGYPAGANVEPVSLAADGDGNVWATDGKTMVQFSQAGNIATSFTLPKSVGVSLLNLAIDGSGDLWAAGYTGLGGNVVKMTSSGTNLSGVGFSSGAFNNTNPDAIAFDSSGDLWMAGPDCGFPCSQFLPSPVVELSNSGVLFDGPTGYSVYGLSETTGLAIDGNGDVWIPNGETNSVSELSNTAANISNLIYTAGGAMQAPSEVAIDGSGNAWVTNSGNGTVTELVGAAAPVVTPLSVGVKNNMLGTRP